MNKYIKYSFIWHLLAIICSTSGSLENHNIANPSCGSGRNHVAVMNKSQCNIHHVAILIVGDSKPPSLQKHSEEMIYHIVNPYDADVFVVTDAEGPPMLQNTNLALSLPIIFKNSLKAVGLMGPIKTERIQALFNKNDHENSTSVRYSKVNKIVGEVASASIQWFRLFECWKLMESYEKEKKILYDVVIRLRLDCTPLPTWNLCESSAVFTSHKKSSIAPFRAIHACTDHVFWGLRNEMKVACYEIWPSINLYFGGSHKNPYSRAFSVVAMLNSMKNIQSLLEKEGWKHYNKISTLPFLDMGGQEKQKSKQQQPHPTPASKNQPHHQLHGNHHRSLQSAEQNAQFQNMIDHLQEAYDLGIDFVDPMTNPNNTKQFEVSNHHPLVKNRKPSANTDIIYFEKYKIVSGFKLEGRPLGLVL